MLTLPPADFRSFALRITPDKSSATVTLIEQPSNRVLPPFKIHFSSSTPALKSQIPEPLPLAAAPPRRNYHGITSLCMTHRITSIDSHPCENQGVGVFFLPPTLENVHNVPHSFPTENFAGARKSSGGHSMKNSIKHSIKAVNVALSVVLLLSPLSLPAHADFKYTDSTKMTGGSLYGLMKFAARFSKKGQNPLDPRRHLALHQGRTSPHR